MKLKIDHNSPTPLHAQVEAMLRKLIEKPEYKEGALLPREVDMANNLGISRNTVRQAINKLVFEGLLVRKKGQGTRVAEKVVDSSLSDKHSFAQKVTMEDKALKSFQIHVQWVNANEQIARFLKIPEGTHILKLNQLHGNDDGPIVYSESCFHPRVGLTGEEDFSQSLYPMLEKNFATVISLSREKIEARPASTIIAKRLGITTIDPVLVRERFVYDQENRPMEYNIGFYNAYEFSYRIDIHR